MPTLKLPGWEIPLPSWAVRYLLPGLLVASLLFIGYQQWTTPQLLTLREAHAQLSATVTEYNLHIMEAPEREEALFTDPDDQMTVRVYRDHCIVIQRRTRNGIRTKLVIDPARELAAVAMAAVSWPSLPVVSAAQDCGGQCWNPHPGEFRWWYGQRIGEWVEVFRAWPDMCVHVQLYNVRWGYWQTNPDGTPAVRWRCCTHR